MIVKDGPFGSVTITDEGGWSGPCPSCARYAAKMKDREGLAKALYLSTEGLDSEMGRWAATFDDLKEEGKNIWLKVADAFLRWMEE